MKLAISEAKARLTDLVRRAEAEEDVVLTRHGHDVARLVALHAKPSCVHRANLIAAIRARAAAKVSNGPKCVLSGSYRPPFNA